MHSSTEEQNAGFAARKRSASSPEPLAQSQAPRQLHSRCARAAGGQSDCCDPMTTQVSVDQLLSLRDIGQRLSARAPAAALAPVASPAQQSMLESPSRPGVTKIPRSPTAQSWVPQKSLIFGKSCWEYRPELFLSSLQVNSLQKAGAAGKPIEAALTICLVDSTACASWHKTSEQMQPPAAEVGHNLASFGLSKQGLLCPAQVCLTR